MNWTEENTAELIRLRAEGRSFSEIGDILGCSRNSAIGRLWRMENPKEPVERDNLNENAWHYRTFAPYPIWKAERQKERELGLR